MASLKDKVQNGFDEARTLILGAQVLVGFEYSGVFQKMFPQLPGPVRYLKALSLVLMLLVLMMLMAPASYHRLRERGADTLRVQRFTSTMMMIALAPFSVALGIDVYAVMQKALGNAPAIIISAGVVLVALFFWYALELIYRRTRASEAQAMSEATKAGASVKTDIKDRVKQVLTEARVVIPGAQALLGFQLVAMLTEEFSKLPEVSVDVHVVSLLMITLAIILLMAPAAYHRIVDRGENTEAFERFAGKMILSAMIALAAGVCGDLYVVIRKIFQDPATAAAVALAMLALFYALWFGMPLYLRSRHRARA